MRILVVDDEPLIRLGLMSLVAEWGYEVDEAADAASAISLLERDAFQLVITDVDMPGSMDGIQLAHYVATKWPPVRLIVVSGKIALGADRLPVGSRFLAKPYDDATLAATLAELASA